MKNITKKIFFRKVNKDDWKYFKKWWTDKELIALTSGDFAFYTDEQLYKWFLNMLKNDNSKDYIVLNENKIVIGHVILDFKKTNVEYHVVIGNKKFLGKGYGTLINLKAIDLVFKKFGFNKVCLKVRPENIRAIKSYEKAGFKKVGKRKYKNMNMPELILMEIRK